jgi:putative hydrolase of the HAD superfamily
VTTHPLLAGTQAVVFDAVGTLIHPQPAAPLVYAEVGRRHGSPLTADAIAARFVEAFRREEEWDWGHGWRTSEEREIGRWRQIVTSVFEDHADAEACFEELFAHFSRPEAWRVEPEAEGVFARLAAGGWTLALASNYDRRLHSVVAGSPWLRGIPHRFISSEIGWRKPAAEFFQAVCGRLGLPPQQVVHVGDDRQNDYDGARGAGMGAVLFDPRGKGAEGNVVRIANLHDLVGGQGK